MSEKNESRIEMLRSMMMIEVAKYNKALAEGSVEQMNAAESEVKELAEQYRAQSQSDLFDLCAKSSKPVYEAIKAGFYKVLRPKIEREDGSIVAMKLSPAERQIDLLALFRYYKLDRVWLGNVERLGMLLCKRTIEGVGGSTKSLEETYRMSDKGKKSTLKGDPTSNTGLLKLLQATVDSIYFEDDGNGKNTVQVNNRDVKYLLNCYAGRGGKLTLRTSNTSTLTRLVAEIMYRVTNNLCYDVKYKMVDSDPTLTAQKATNEKAKAEKAAKAKEEVVELERPATEPATEEAVA